MATFIKGNYRKSIYHNESGYLIGLFKVKETNDDNLDIYVNRTITFTGYFHEINDQDTYILYGDLITHERYGEQFNVSSYERVMPEEKDSIVTFLTSGLFKGIGETKAKKIVDVLGKDTLTIILEHPDNLLLIPTVTKKNVEVLHNKLVEYQASYQMILSLTEMGFSTKDSLLIYNKYLDKTIDVVQKDLYQITSDIKEITFKKIDIIALKSNYLKNDPRRVKAAIIYIMDEVCNLYGHSYLLKEEIYSYTCRCLDYRLEQEEFLTALEQSQVDMQLIRQKDNYYLTEMYEAEQNIASRFKYLSKKVDNHEKKLDRYLSDVEQFFNMSYSLEQKEAIKNSFLKHFLIITGGPGTGKTTIIQAVTELYRMTHELSYEKLQEKIALLAPTGRASKRISETTLLSASTIHRFLKWNKETNKFAVNEHNKSDVEFVIIDEVSMIDTLLLNHLLNGLHYDTKIILVGDYNQLPSVGPGQILKDLVESDCVNVVKLNRLYRQGKDSNIITLAYDINQGLLNEDLLMTESDLIFKECSSLELKNKVIEMAKQYKNENYKKFQVLAPMYKTINGIDELNIALQAIFNPKTKTKKEINISGFVYRENDKVIQLTNMPEENIFNGDIGVIETIENDKNKCVYINFDGNVVKYTASNFQKFKHAYAISIHKSQGSEFDTVIIPVVREYGKMLYRKLIYTAVTRSKKNLILVGDINALNQAIKNNNSDIRRTSLKDMLEK